MSQYYHFNAHQQHPTQAAAAGHHGGRNRRQPRLSVSQNQSHKQFRGVRSMKELPTESPSVSTFRRTFELGRSFDLDDDLDFVPGLITENDLAYSGSERSSLASNSPAGSPTQQPQVVAPTYQLNSNSPAFMPSFQAPHTGLKLHQPAATRARNAIPIINPANGQGLTMPSPPSSVSPSVRMQQHNLRHRW
ncbi:hypothetical protein BD289DRAFT_483924 [Coniella lustricola]|uniref:Uncharacterized protein n=1 Tax=Coniella lustricola TaxID=2025994 RepID=A0A2T3A3T3_9PEZI|nr:hypothetical protein BD289DRAFT_483924 [Coniella lustricola]